MPAPDLDVEAEPVDAPHALDQRQVGEHHLGADRQLDFTHDMSIASGPAWMHTNI